jgi:hypothetical protein
VLCLEDFLYVDSEANECACMHRAWRPFRTVPASMWARSLPTTRRRIFALPPDIILVLCTHLAGLESNALALTSHVLRHCSSRYTCPNSGWPAESHAGHGGRHRSRVRGDAPVAFVPSETRQPPPIERRTRPLNHFACAAPRPCNAVHPDQYWLTQLQPPVVDSMLAGAVVVPGLAGFEQLDCRVSRGTVQAS